MIGILLVLAMAILLCMLAVLSQGTRKVKRIAARITPIVMISGLALYSMGYLPERADGLFAAAVRATTSACMMLVGRNDFSGMMKAPWFATSVLWQTVFWLLHLAAILMSASAILMSLGRGLSEKLRLWLSGGRPIWLFSGFSADTISITRLRPKGTLVVFSDIPNDKSCEEQCAALDAVIIPESTISGGVLSPSIYSFLCSKHGAEITLFAVSNSESKNFSVANAVLECYRKKSWSMKRLFIKVVTKSAAGSENLDALHDEAYPSPASLEAFSPYELAARLLVRNAPPYQTMSFNENGLADGDYHAVIIGFGQIGQEVLRELLKNGCFTGGSPRVDIIDREVPSGRFMRRYAGMFENYNVRFHSIDSRSEEFFAFLDTENESIRQIIICEGADEANKDTATDIERYYCRLPGRRPTICICNKRYILTAPNARMLGAKRQPLICSETIVRHALDRHAKAVNLSYYEVTGHPGQADELWAKASMLSRESCRASAEYIPAMLKMAGFDPNNPPSAEAYTERVQGELLENMATAEHLRWNAFHYTMGYVCMSAEQISARAAAGESVIHKHSESFMHGCLVSWDKLDDLSSLVSKLRNTQIDYKELDRANVRNLPRTLALEKGLA